MCFGWLGFFFVDVKFIYKQLLLKEVSCDSVNDIWE